MKKYKAMKLVKALRSGEYKQGKDALVNSDDKFCCLGVACNISKLPLPWYLGDYGWNIDGSYTELPDSIQKEYGFYDNIGGRRDESSLDIGGEYYGSLANANDQGVTFDQIADYIEANYKDL